MKNVNLEHLNKVNLEVAEILDAEEIEGADHIIKLKLKVGKKRRRKNAVAPKPKNRKLWTLRNKRIFVVSNIRPKKIQGIKSEVLPLTTEVRRSTQFVFADKDIPVGAELY